MECRWATSAGNRAGLEGGDAVQLRLERRDAQLVDRGRVHAARVFVANFLFVGGARGRGRGGLLENLLQVQAVELKELGEAAVGCLVRGQRVALEPAVATELVEVVAGVDGLVDERRVEHAQLGDAQLRRGGHGSLCVGCDGSERDGEKSGENDRERSNENG